MPKCRDRRLRKVSLLVRCLRRFQAVLRVATENLSSSAVDYPIFSIAGLYTCYSKWIHLCAATFVPNKKWSVCSCNLHVLKTINHWMYRVLPVTVASEYARCYSAWRLKKRKSIRYSSNCTHLPQIFEWMAFYYPETSPQPTHCLIITALCEVVHISNSMRVVHPCPFPGKPTYNRRTLPYLPPLASCLQQFSLTHFVTGVLWPTGYLSLKFGFRNNNIVVMGTKEYILFSHCQWLGY